ncbi:acyl carrier protein [Enhygromyxa salina]|uniref:acyl carrier protein n=1 Tax=Enhygromyxa salina TaxID=215803 RepID=UPI0011B21D2E|nr:acyl carrier protein [Enhygromyxa salina]
MTKSAEQKNLRAHLERATAALEQAKQRQRARLDASREAHERGRLRPASLHRGEWQRSAASGISVTPTGPLAFTARSPSALRRQVPRDRAPLDLVHSEIASVLGDRPREELGLDSLVTVELRNRLQVWTGLQPASLRIDPPSPSRPDEASFDMFDSKIEGMNS